MLSSVKMATVWRQLLAKWGWYCRGRGGEESYRRKKDRNEQFSVGKGGELRGGRPVGEVCLGGKESRDQKEGEPHDKGG